jgi:GDP/UDP-N,N'-diacetylbacillosamine 2-epimerase (hydrolysing)
MKRKITVTTGTRAEYGILRPILRKIVKNPKLQLCLLVTGTHLSKKHGYSISEIKKDGFKIYRKFDMLPKGNTNYHMSLALAKGVEHFSKIFQKIKPDINLILGDRDEMLVSALAAYHMNIPNAHIHGGDKSRGIDEYTRHAITKISNIHFAATQKSYKRIIKLGENPNYVFKSGSPGIDEVVSNKITSKKDLEKKFNITFTGNEILLVYHPDTTQAQKSGIQINKILSAISNLKKPTIALGPNSDAGSKEILDTLIKFSRQNQHFQFYRNLQRNDYLGLLNNIGVLVGNSSSGIIEASYFAIPVVNIGIRQKGREKGRNVIDVSDEKSHLIQNAILVALKRKKKGNLSKTRIYGNGNASKKIVSILEKIKLDKKLIQKQIFY